MDDLPRTNGINPQPGDAAQRPAPPKENLKETIESILVAFILAFVFRAFIVEAFVIPSGSMAPTLLGGHMRFACEDCGYSFDLNYPQDTSRDDNLSIPSIAQNSVFSVHCPNCGLKVARKNLRDPAGAATSPPVYYGDRILVLKYLYLLQDPRRWDVVVFKSPTDPATHDYTQNFIKRLVGRPGETLMLLDGDVYTCPNDKATRGEIDAWAWQVHSKHDAAQRALWRIVYDNDHHPQDAQRQWTQPWQPRNGTGWDTHSADKTGRIFRFSNANGAGTLFFNKDANPYTFPLTDWLPYNESKVQSAAGIDNYRTEAYGDERIPRWHVGDLRLQFDYQRESGDGPLRASLGKLNHAFTVELMPGKARLLHRLPSGDVRAVGGEIPLPSTKGSRRVELWNVDYQVTLWIDGREVIRTTPSEYAPDVADLLRRHRERMALADRGAPPAQIREVFPAPTIEISAERQSASLSHLSLWRDIYYTPNYNNYIGRIDHASPERPVHLHRRGDRDQAGNILDNEYFVLGDNSILSGDARAWTDPINLRSTEDLVAAAGRVPERFLLGKAFFVYWPPGLRPFSVTAPGIVPNFGDMRFIH